MTRNERTERRLDLIIKLLKKRKGADEIDSFLERESKGRGPESEKRAIEAIAPLTFVESVKKASESDDGRGVDLWVFYTQESGHANTPVQVKSSYVAVENSRIRPKYKKLREKKRLIIINGGIQRPIRKIRHDFKKELRELDGYI